ncbi:MAG: hypothetical protein ACR2HR_16125 [Euzebya sp.]
MTRTAAVVALACALMLSSCANVGQLLGAGQQTSVADAVAVLPSGATSSPDVAEDHIPTPAASATTQPGASAVAGIPQELCRVVDPQWCLDTDADSVPDVVERALGYDPAVIDCLLADCGASAAVEQVIRTARAPVLVAVDGSAVMAAAFGEATRIDAVRRAIQRLAVGTPDYVPVGVTSFGDRGSAADADRLESCSTVTTHAFPEELTADSADDVAGRVQAVGFRPIAAMIQAAGPILQAARQRSDPAGQGPPPQLLLLTSGADNCDGDPLAALDQLAAADMAPAVDVIAMDVPPADVGALQALAQRTGGSFTAVRDPAGLNGAVEQMAARPAEALRGSVCEFTAGAALSRCELAYRDAVRAHLVQQIDGARQQGEADLVEALEAFAAAVDASLTQRLTQPAPANAELEALYLQAVAARERFQQRFDTPLPGDELSACTLTPEVA